MDASQVEVLLKIVHDLNMDLEVVVEPTFREKDGLAMSSRNAYLSAEQRKQATVLYRALTRIQMLTDTGEHDAAKLIEAGKQVVAEEPAAKLDYFEVVHPDTLEPLSDIRKGGLVAVAAWIGTTRLIDNIVIHGVGQASGPSVG